MTYLLLAIFEHPYAVHVDWKVTISIEFVCLCYFLINLYLHAKRLRHVEISKQSSGYWVRMVVMIILILDAIISEVSLIWSAGLPKRPASTPVGVTGVAC